MSFTVQLTRQAEKDIDGLPSDVRDRIITALIALEGEPRPHGVVGVRTEPPGNYRLRVGDYRVGYEVDEDNCLVTVWQVGHRKRFYERARRRTG